MIYFDSAYVAKFYLNEPGHEAVRSCAIAAGDVATRELALVEVSAVFTASCAKIFSHRMRRQFSSRNLTATCSKDSGSCSR